MRGWIPVPGTAQERLVRAALDRFGTQRYDAVGVGELASAAGVTTGSLYHHFGNKLALYAIVRAEVEHRAIDRMRGAAAVAPITSVTGAGPMLLVGFDYLVAAGFARLLGEEHPVDVGGHPPPDPIAAMLAEFLDEPTIPVSIALTAAWRACVRDASSAGPLPARAALARLLGVEPGQPPSRSARANREDIMTELPMVGAPATRALTAAGHRSLESLAGADQDELLALHGFGPRAVRIIQEALAAAHLPSLSRPGG